MKNKVIRFIPSKLQEHIYFQNEEYGIEVYFHANYAIGYSGKKGKPDFYYKYPNHEIAKERVDKWIKSTIAMFEDKKQKAEKKKELQKNAKAEDYFKIGDILVSSWGYEQTNVEFYEILDIKKKRVKITPISKKITEGIGFMAGNCIPIPLAEKGKNNVAGTWHNIKLSLCGENVHASLAGFQTYEHVHKWDGKPEYISWYA